MRIRTDQLETSLKERVRRMVDEAHLPQKLTWRADVHVRDLAKSGSPMDRFNDGKFEVKKNGDTWVFDGGVSETDVKVGWTIEIEIGNGTIIATPLFHSVIKSGPDEPFLTFRLGFEAKIAGTIGTLLPIFPENMLVLINRYSLSNPYGLRNDILHDRHEFMLFFREKLLGSHH